MIALRTSLLAGCAVTALLCTAASAEDADGQAQGDFAGYFDVFAAFNVGEEDGNPLSTDEWDGPQFSGAGHAAWRISRLVSVQVDGWFEHWSGSIGCSGLCKKSKKSASDDSAEVWAGLAKHVTFHVSPDLSFGTLFSYGYTSERPQKHAGVEGHFGNVALEAVYARANHRLYAQLGYASGMSKYAETWRSRDLYAQIVATYYLSDQLAISGTLGYEQYYELNDDDYGWNSVNWGGQIEYQHDGQPIVYYLAYSGEYGDWRDSDLTWNDHFIGGGVKFLFGATSIRGRDNAVGLSDFNPLFGTTFRR